MQLETTHTAAATLVAVMEDRVDAAVAIQFKDAMREATQTGSARVVLDLGRVSFLDSSGLGAVIGAMKQMAPDRQLELAALTPAVEKVFRLTRMDSIFVIHDTPEAAMGTAGIPPAADTAHAC